MGRSAGEALVLPLALALASNPTPEEYMAHVGGDAKIVGAKELKIDGQRMIFGGFQSIIEM